MVKDGAYDKKNNRHFSKDRQCNGQISSGIGVLTFDIIPIPIRPKVDAVGIRDYFGEMSNLNVFARISTIDKS